MTADDYYRMGKAISKPSKVGCDAGFIVSAYGRAVHIIPFVGKGYTIEARGKRYGVVKYALSDPINGAYKRKAKWRRLPFDLGDLSGEVTRRTLWLTKPYMHGADVRDVQNFLAMMPRSERDGVYGPKTELAVRRFQEARHLEVDGVVGPLTWAELTRGA
jgi:peptidoglycan hydrolase-like protein with peptidoglycan-binding domain